MNSWKTSFTAGRHIASNQVQITVLSGAASGLHKQSWDTTVEVSSGWDPAKRF